ncbi:hypothetical protein BD413DRAFT_302713 [Trametes elegans]|nr:hypothetical protein BD413DRAFT_302713 [Trametes elegans]
MHAYIHTPIPHVRTTTHPSRPHICTQPAPPLTRPFIYPHPPIYSPHMSHPTRPALSPAANMPRGLASSRCTYAYYTPRNTQHTHTYAHTYIPPASPAPSLTLSSTSSSPLAPCPLLLLMSSRHLCSPSILSIAPGFIHPLVRPARGVWYPRPHAGLRAAATRTCTRSVYTHPRFARRLAIVVIVAAAAVLSVVR